MNFFRRVREWFSLVNENIALRKQYDQMMKELEAKITNAKTDEERKKHIAFKREITQLGEKVRREYKEQLAEDSNGPDSRKM